MGRDGDAVALGGAFTVGEALAAGIPPGRLRSRRLERPSHGVRGQPGANWSERTASILREMSPHAFLMGPSAGVVWHLPLPAFLERQAAALIHVGMPRGRRAAKRSGVIGRTISLRTSDLTSCRGIRITTFARTWFDLATLLELPDLVAVADALVFHESARCTRAELEEIVRSNPHSPGVVRAREALELISERAESPQESRLRVVLHLAGLPDPEVNAIIVDADGRVIARVDLLYREFRVILEYEGLHHATDPAQWRRDISRIAELQSMGYIVIRVHKDDLTHPHDLVRRLRRHLFARR